MGNRTGLNRSKWNSPSACAEYDWHSETCSCETRKKYTNVAVWGKIKSYLNTSCVVRIFTALI